MSPSVLQWIVAHLSVIGWPAIIYAVYRIVVACFKIGRAATLIEQRVLDGERTLHLVATNHLPHIQVAMEDTNKTLQGIREDLRLLMVKD